MNKLHWASVGLFCVLLVVIHYSKAPFGSLVLDTNLQASAAAEQDDHKISWVKQDASFPREVQLAVYDNETAWSRDPRVKNVQIYQKSVIHRQRVVDSVFGGDLSRIRPWEGYFGGYYLWDFFPPAYNCPSHERLGKLSEGGKVLCELDKLVDLGRNCTVMSFGVRGDISFEEELIQRTECTVYAFDPSVDSLPDGSLEKRFCPSTAGAPCRGVIKFFKLGLAPMNFIDERGWQLKSMTTLMEHVGVRHIDLLKIDIEGGEWDVFSSSQDTSWLQLVDQFLVEIHFKQAETNTAGPSSGVRETFHLFEVLEKNLLYPFSWEVNYNPPGFYQLKPFCIEYSFVRAPAISSALPAGMGGNFNEGGDVQVNQDSGVVVPTEIVTKRNLHAITVLTRVYDACAEYDGLIERTKNLLTRKWAVDNYDFVIFYEPALPPEHKKYILDGLKPYESNIFFEDVSAVIESGLGKMNVSNEALCPSTDVSRAFNMGYKGMCYFWYGGFINTDAAKRYKTFFRIDDDVLIQKELPGFHPFSRSHLSTVTFIGHDNPNVIVGMEPLFRRLASHRKGGEFPSVWKLPYTNVMSFDLDWVRSAEVQSIMSAVYASGCIVSNRWGDLPLWGATAALLNVDIQSIQLEYRHGSHNLVASPDHMAGETDSQARDGYLGENGLLYLAVCVVACACAFGLLSRRRNKSALL